MMNAMKNKIIGCYFCSRKSKQIYDTALLKAACRK